MRILKTLNPRRTVSFFLSLAMIMGLWVFAPALVEGVTTAEALDSYQLYPKPQRIVYQAGEFALAGVVNVLLGNAGDQVTKNKIAAILDDEGIAYSFGTAVVAGANNIILGVSGGGTAAETYFGTCGFADTAALNTSSGYDGYVLGTHNDNIVIVGRDSKSLYYGVTTLKQMLAQGHTIKNLLINDFADSEVRGVVEGYYGIPWSFESRKSILEMSGNFKMNSYVYAPKDDPYHFGVQWSEPYPEKELEELRQLVEIAKANNVSFVWTTHVSTHMDFFDADDAFNATRNVKTSAQWIESDRGTTTTAAWQVPNGQKQVDTYGEADTYQKLFAKYEQLYSIGVRQFGFLIDDINFEIARFNVIHYTTAANKIVEWGKEKGDVGPLMLCPTYYYQNDIAYNGRTYMRTLKGNPYAAATTVVPAQAGSPTWNGTAVRVAEPGLDDSVQVMYTGDHVMASVFSNSGGYNGNPGDTRLGQGNYYFTYNATVAGTAGADAKYSQTGMRRLPLIWWNYPVTDYMTSRIMMGPTPIDESNMVPSSTTTANYPNYYGLNPNAKGTMLGVVANPMQQGHVSEIALFGVADFTWNMNGFNARQNWADSFDYLYPEVAESMQLFAQHNQRGTYNNIKMPLNQESTALAPLMTAFQNAISAATLNPATVNSTGAALMVEVNKLDAAIADIKANGSTLLLDDLNPWLDKGASLCNAIRSAVNMYAAYFVNDDQAVWENYSLAQAEKLDWPKIVAPLLGGSVIVEVGTQRLKPFVDTVLTRIDTLMASYSPYDVKTSTNRAYTNIATLKSAAITTSGNNRTISLSTLASLDPARYVGIQLDMVRKLSAISVAGTLDANLTVEYSANGAEWKAVASLPASFTDEPARYVRVKNNTGAAISTSALTSLSLTVSAGETYPATAATNVPIYQTNNVANMLTEALTTSFWSSRGQEAGDQVTITYTNPVTIYDLTLYSSNSDNVKAGYMEVSDGTTWTKVMDMNKNVSLETVSGTQYVVERVVLGGMTVKQLRIVLTAASSNWLRIFSLRLNVQSGHGVGIVPPTLLASGGWAPAAVDSVSSTAFSAAGTDTLTYSLSEFTNANELVVLQNARTVGSAEIKAQVIQDGVTAWVDLGVLDKACWEYDLAAFDKILQVEISWDPDTSPVMIHEIHTKTSLNKTSLQQAVAAFQALPAANTFTAPSWEDAVSAYGDITNDHLLDDYIAQSTVDKVANALWDALDGLEVIDFDFGTQTASVVIRKGMKYQLNINTNNEGMVVYVSSNANATVDANGLVTAVKTGSAVITVIDVWAQRYFTITINITS